jgi:autotransporter-associated beta strand protein
MTEDVFYNFDNVLFNDSSANPVVTLDTFVQPASVTFSNTANLYRISGSGGVIGSTGLGKGGAGTLVIETVNDYVGNTMVQGGTLQLGNGGTSGNVRGHITNNATVVFNRSDVFTTSNNISGSGRVVNVGSGINTLAGTNSYTGGTTNVSGSTLVGTTFSLPGAIVNDGTLLVNQSFPGILAGAVSGGGDLTVAGSGGTVILTNANSHAGLTTVSNYSTLVLSNVSGGYALTNTLVIGEGHTQAIAQIGAPYQQMPPETVVLFKSSTNSGRSAKFQLLNNSQVVGGITNLTGTVSVIENNSTGNGLLTISNRFDNYWDQFLRNQGGTLGLTKDGSATLTLAGANVSYTGPTLVKSGTLALTNTTALSSDTAVTGGQLVLQSGTAGTAVNLTNFIPGGLSLSSLSPTPAAFTLGGLGGSGDLGLTNSAGDPVALTVGTRNLTNLYSGVLSGPGQLIKAGSGTFPERVRRRHAGFRWHLPGGQWRRHSRRPECRSRHQQCHPCLQPYGYRHVGELHNRHWGLDREQRHASHQQQLKYLQRSDAREIRHLEPGVRQQQFHWRRNGARRSGWRYPDRQRTNFPGEFEQHYYRQRHG